MAAILCDADRWKNWDGFLEATAETGFMQSSWWALFRARVGYQYFCVTVKDQHDVVGGALVAKWSYAPKRCFYFMQVGPVLPQEGAGAAVVFSTILRNIEEHRKGEDALVSQLRIEPRWSRLPGFVSGFQALAFADPYTE